MKRKIAAILAADLVGYSRLMAEDEEETMRRLMSYRAVFDDFITKAEGRIFNTAGDAVLAEFPSAVDAVRAAIDIQESLRTRNMSYPPSRHMVFRIGLTIGDVIEREGDLLGDGVNVAARLQGLATPGGICVSRSVHEQVADKLSVIFSDLGPQDVKNIPRPVHAYRVQLEKVAEPTSVANPNAPTQATHRRPMALLVGTAVVAIALGALGSFLLLDKPWVRQGAETKQAAVAAPTATNPAAGPAALTALSASPSSPNSATDLVDGLASILEKGETKESAQLRKDNAAAFSKLALHRAMALAPKVRRHWKTGGWPSRTVAEERVLEKCSQFYDEPCAVIAADQSLAQPNSDGTWSTQDAPKVNYSGLFDPASIPGLREQQLHSPEVLGYATFTGPKAAAFHAEGLFTVSMGATSQRSAEEQALNACNASPDRAKSGNRPCYLYAVENRVVLPQRLTLPLTPEPQNPQKATPSTAPAASFESSLLAAMEEISPAMSDKIRVREGSFYVTSGQHKALAMHPPYDSWRRTFLPNEKAAEEVALEGCEVRYGDPCVLLAIDESLKQRPLAGEWPKRPMPRVSYGGSFDPQQIPALKESDRGRPDIASYRSVNGPKAAALHPYGLIFIASSSESQFAAEEKALADCNGDPMRNGRDGTCWLYAVGDQVVLSKRSRFPITPKS